MFRRICTSSFFVKTGAVFTGVTLYGAWEYSQNQTDHIAYASWWGNSGKDTSTVPGPKPVGMAAAYPFIKDMPIVEQELRPAPYVPDPVTHNVPVRLQVKLTSELAIKPCSPQHKYEYWTYNGSIPGPMIRGRVGDVLEVTHENKDAIGHNIDFHAVTGPGGGGPALYAEQGEHKIGIFKLMQAGLYVYHCSAAPVPSHIANGMYGLILVEPEGGLPRVDREFYVMQSEIYGEQNPSDLKMLDYSYSNGMAEHPTYVV
eukprot:PhF_6_TR15073/c0_g1_i2/m.23697